MALHEIARFMMRPLPDKVYLQLLYYYNTGKLINFRNPRSFNEKLQWLKLHDRRPEYTAMVDKLLAKDYVGKIIGNEHIVPTLGVWDRAEEIDFDTLPDQFVLKCNHDSGSVVICHDKAQLDRCAAIKKLNKGLKKNGYWYGREWPYKNVKRKVFAEEYLENGNNELTDYKVHCFNGLPRLILVCQSRFNNMTEDFYTENWSRLELSRPNNPRSQTVMDKPELLDRILESAKELSTDTSFVRVDFYIVKNQFYFGELTFYPASGFEGFEPREWDNVIGEWIRLND